jgi:hypothetical protein
VSVSPLSSTRSSLDYSTTRYISDSDPLNPNPTTLQSLQKLRQTDYRLEQPGQPFNEAPSMKVLTSYDDVEPYSLTTESNFEVVYSTHKF